jgi:hypothetical protein
LIDYIDAEVREVCRRNGWRAQVRRKWSAREKPVSSSDIDDYEWKLIPGRDYSPDTYVSTAEAVIDEGTYFVLGFDASSGVFVLQHDMFHGGSIDDRRFMCTYTEIDLRWATVAEHVAQGGEPAPDDQPDWTRAVPPSGMLARFLQDLTTRFRPNLFSIT